MLSYLTLAWNQHEVSSTNVAERISSRLCAAPTSWTTCFSGPGLRVLLPVSSRIRPPLIQLRNGAGIILGNIFQSSYQISPTSTSPCKSLLDWDESEILATEGRSIIRSHWGNYVLFLLHPNTTNVHVLRGPMSFLPCYWTKVSGLTIFFSRPTDLANLGVTTPNVNWDRILAQAAMRDYFCEETSLRGIYSLVPGDCINIQLGRNTCQTYWMPARTTAEISVVDFDSAVEILRSVTHNVVSCWSSLYKSIIVSLSGGFDSSVVLSCVKNAPSKPHVHAVNFYTNGPGDERHYARSMTEKCDVPLTEIALPNSVDLGPTLNCTKTANPVINASGFSTQRIFLHLSEEFNADAVFTGDLGDAVFGHGYGTELLAEAIWRYKFTSSALKIIFDYAMLYRISIWKALRISLCEYHLYRKSHLWEFHKHMMASDARRPDGLATEDAMSHYAQIERRFAHPWFLKSDNIAPGCIQIIPFLILMTETLGHYGLSDVSDSLFTSPLVSQPLVETMLAIPGPFHIAGSQNAAVASCAFEPELSSLLLGRGKDKGGVNPWLDDVIARNRSFLSNVLLDGILVREQILDRRKIEIALSGKITDAKAASIEIIIDLCIESWLRQWISHHS